MTRKDPRIDAFIAHAAPFAQPILSHLRELVHKACPDVEETIKWGQPFFLRNRILCNIASFKSHCAFGFWDPSMRSFLSKKKEAKPAWGHFGRITALSGLPPDNVILELVRKAAALDEVGGTRRPAPRKRKLAVPKYFAQALKKTRGASAEFAVFSESKKADYIEWLEEAKTEETRARRLATAVEWISKGKSRNWKYEKP